LPLKIELKPGERIILGDCVVINQQQRTRLVIEGRVPILREKDIITPGSADSPAKQLYLAVQLIYVTKQPAENYASYLRLAKKMLEADLGAKPYIDRINNRILTGELYKALKEARKLIAYEEERPEMNYASKAYVKTATNIASPRELEANLLLNAAAKLQSVHDSWKDKPSGLRDAIMYNRRLWTVFIDALVRPDNKLPAQIRENLVKIGAFVMGETFALMTEPKQQHLKTIIKINRKIAAGLRGGA
jgi:flagellar biosynthesis repressor protein FlbT